MNRASSTIIPAVLIALFLTIPIPTDAADSLSVLTLSADAAETPGGFQELDSAEAIQAIEDLKAVWAGLESEVATGEIRYLTLNFTLKDRQLTCDQFLAELQQTALTADATLTRTLVEKFCPEKLTGTVEQQTATLDAVGDWRTLRIQGEDRRCLSQVFEHVVKDDLHLLVDHPNRNVTAHRRGSCRYWSETLGWFRTIPPAALLSDATIRKENRDLYRLAYFGPSSTDNPDRHESWMTLDPNDGLPREWRMHSPETGELLRAEVYQDFTMYPGDVLCPAVHIKLNADQNLVTNVRMTVIEQARFNMPFEPNDFVLSTPAKWSWFDLRTDPATGGHWTEPTDDVADFFKSRSANPVPQRREVTSSELWRSPLMMLNGVILIVVGVTLWRRSG
ncbi:hypothetical protein SH661x_000654 [Planctomicrobium sp. SH661]|uniref:hypothetical protein n=1 Tax=Planctomicrobium sp. SH661 TaxID=3448124 RepID=UPI003F5BD8FA